MSITKRVLAPAAGGEWCHFLVQWRDSHVIQHGRTFATWPEAAESEAAVKAGRPPPATVTAALRAHLRRYPPGPAGLLFTTPAGTVLNPVNWRHRTWRPLTRSAPGIPAGTTFYRIRHAYASLLGDAGRPDHEIQRRRSARFADTGRHLLGPRLSKAPHPAVPVWSRPAGRWRTVAAGLTVTRATAAATCGG